MTEPKEDRVEKDALGYPVQFFWPSSHFALVYQSLCFRTTADGHLYDWIGEKYIDWLSVILLSYDSFLSLLRLDHRKKSGRDP